MKPSLRVAAVLAVGLAAATLMTASGPSRGGDAFPTREPAVPAAFTRISSPTPLPGFALRVGDALLVTCPGLIVVDPDVHKVRLACRPDATATASPVTSTATSTVIASTSTPSATAVPSSTATATVIARSPFALGVRLAGDPGVVAFANVHFLSTDFVHMSVAGIGLLNSVTVAERQVSIGSPVDLAAALSAAQSSGIDTIMLNEEIPFAQCQQLSDDEATVSRQVHAAGLRLVFAPTVVDVEHCLDQYPFAQNADGFMIQAQSKQNSPTFAADVHALNRRLRALHPGLYIEDQVSVNPPSNRLETAAATLADIAALADGSRDAPEAINIFFSGSADRTAVMEAVAGSLRP